MFPQRAFCLNVFSFGCEPQVRGFVNSHRRGSLSCEHRREAHCYDALDLLQPLLKRVTFVPFGLGHLLGLFPTARLG
jgi:hypothetical protein